MGGHCLPVDPFYLAWKAREYGQPTEFVELAGEVNQRMPEFCVERIATRAERPRQGRARLADRHPRRVLQAGRRRPARVAGAEDHAPARRARRRPRLPRRLRARAARLRARDRCRWTRRSRRRLRGDRDRPPGPRRGGRGGAARRWSWTSAASRAASRRRTWCGCERRPGEGRGRRPRLLGPEPGPQLRPPAGRASWPGSATPTTRRRERAGRGVPRRARRRPTSTSCWPTPSSTPWWWPRRCPPTPPWPSACSAAGKHCFVEKPLAQSVGRRRARGGRRARRRAGC